MKRIPIEDFEDWLDNPVTLGFIKLIKDEAAAYREMAASGHPLSMGSFERIGEKYFSLINAAMAYENLLDNLAYDNIFPSTEEEYNDDKVSTDGEPTLN